MDTIEGGGGHGQRLLVVRGDLNSASGYSQAIALYVAKLAIRFDLVVGVDLHPNPVRLLERWPYPTLSDVEVPSALREAGVGSLVLHVTTPDRFRRFAGARNVGLFFWETSAIHQKRWNDGLAAMDEVWLPARFMIDTLRAEGITTPLRHVPCPLDELAAPRVEAVDDPDLVLHELSADAATRPLSSLVDLRRRYRHIALCTNTLLARKGFPILASEWFGFVASRDDAALVIKASSIDVTESSTALLDRISRLFLHVLARGADRPRPRPHVFVTTANLSEAEMRSLLEAADLFVTASFGEGLGLGVFEALLAGRPAVCPRHTSFAELLPDDYPFWVDCDIGNVGLHDPVGLVPPSARWGLVREGALRLALERCVADIEAGTAGDHAARAARAAVASSTVDYDALVAGTLRSAAWPAS